MRKIYFVLLCLITFSCNQDVVVEDSVSDTSTMRNVPLTYIDDADGGYTYKCSGDGSKCSSLNPGVCGSICQIKTAANTLGINIRTKATSDRLLNLFPDLYSLRDILDDYDLGKELVDNYYKIGTLHYNEQINISVSNQTNVVLAIINKASLISEFISNENSSSILLNTADVVKYEGLINDMRLDSANTEYQSALDFFETKINDIENKTISEVYNIL